eukprot:6653477-Pyramimonas_sp.AAC.1
MSMNSVDELTSYMFGSFTFPSHHLSVGSIRPARTCVWRRSIRLDEDESLSATKGTTPRNACAFFALNPFLAVRDDQSSLRRPFVATFDVGA